MASLNLISQEVCILLDLGKVLFNQFESVWITNLLVLDLQTSFVQSARSLKYAILEIYFNHKGIPKYLHLMFMDLCGRIVWQAIQCVKL